MPVPGLSGGICFRFGYRKYEQNISHGVGSRCCGIFSQIRRGPLWNFLFAYYCFVLWKRKVVFFPGIERLGYVVLLWRFFFRIFFPIAVRAGLFLGCLCRGCSVFQQVRNQGSLSLFFYETRASFLAGLILGDGCSVLKRWWSACLWVLFAAWFGVLRYFVLQGSDLDRKRKYHRYCQGLCFQGLVRNRCR